MGVGVILESLCMCLYYHISVCPYFPSTHCSLPPVLQVEEPQPIRINFFFFLEHESLQNKCYHGVLQGSIRLYAVIFSLPSIFYSALLQFVASCVNL